MVPLNNFNYRSVRWLIFSTIKAAETALPLQLAYPSAAKPLSGSATEPLEAAASSAWIIAFIMLSAR
jgi:hypothetical protein